MAEPINGSAAGSPVPSVAIPVAASDSLTGAEQHPHEEHVAPATTSPTPEPPPPPAAAAPAAATATAHLPPHLTLSHQPPTSDLVPDVWSTEPPFWQPLKSVGPGELWSFVVFLAIGPVVSLVCYGLEVVADLCEQALSLLNGSQPYVFFVILPVALPLIVHVSDTYFVGISGSGLPKTLLSYRLGNTKPKRVPDGLWDDLWNGGLYEGHLSIKIALSKWLACALAILAGASVGPEGPAVHVGASIAASLHKLTNLPFFYPKGAIMAGSAMALASLFNAPLTGLVFAIEEIGGQFEYFGQRISVVAIVAIGGLVTSSIHGYEPYFGLRDNPFDVMEWGAVPIVGILCGLLGGAFTRAVVEAAKFRKVNPQFSAKWNLPFAALMGLFIVLLSAFSEGFVYGPGASFSKEIFDAATDGTLTSNIDYALYGPFKTLATLFAAVSGVPGGLFVPSISAGVGWGTIMSWICPFANPETVVILSMVAYFAGVTQGIFTSVVVAYEMTNFQNSHLYPALMVSVIAAFASKIVCPYPFYAYLVRVGNQPIPVAVTKAGQGTFFAQTGE